MDKGSDAMKDHDLKEKLPQSFWNFSDKNAAEIQREIRTTRAELDETVQAIQERLAPQQFINHFSDMVRDSVRQGSPKVMEMIRNNPLPSSLVVLGLGWLFIRGSAGPQRQITRGYGRYDTLEEEEYGLTGGGPVSSIEVTDMSSGVGGPSTYEQGKQKASQATRRVKDKAGHWTEQAKETAGHWTEQAKETAGQWTEQAKGKASQWTGQAKDKAGQLASQTRERASQMASGVIHKAGDVASQMAGATRDKAGQLAGATMETAGHLMSATASKAGDLAQSTMESAGHLMSATASVAGDLAHSTTEMTGNVVHRAGEQARNLGAATQRQIKHAGTETSRLYQEKPGAFALLCIGVGAALAMSLPTTRKEQELVGEQSEAFKQQLQQAGQQVMGKVEEIVSAGQESMKDEARKQDVI